MLYRGTVLAEAQTWSERNTASRDETRFLNRSQQVETERQEREARAARNLRYALFGLVGVILVAAIGLTLIFAQNNADLLAEVNYIESQINYAATRDFSLSPLEITLTPAENFFATATAYANIDNFSWNPVTEEFGGVEMVLVPAGCFFMGSNDRSNEQPIHEVCIEEDFWIDKYEVTNEQFGGVSEQVACSERSSEPDQPRNCVNWFESLEHCRSRDATLPTEAQWEYAARGPDSLVYPWGNEYIAGNVIGEDDPTYGNISTAPVGSRPEGASWVGAMDMSGNVWEWTLSEYRDYPYDAQDGRNNNQDSTDGHRVYRGGDFGAASYFLRSVNRGESDPRIINLQLGFRCVRNYAG
jgi:hypothetical protein